MRETSARLLQLLGLLQARPVWSGRELAERLGVSARTVRRDVQRLRDLDYPVHAMQGAAGYRLGAGGRLPPLLLAEEEAVAVVLGLRSVSQSPVRGVEEAAVRALVKLEQVLPTRLRQRVAALAATTVRAGDPTVPQVPVERLMAISDACRRRERVRLDYTDARNVTSRRDIEPYRAVCFNRRWYLIAFDVEAQEWRTFRVDRLNLRIPTGPRFEPRPIPRGDAVAYLEDQLSTQTWPARAAVRLFAPAEEVAEQLWPGMGTVAPDGPHRCVLHVGAPSARDLAWMITTIDADFELLEAPAELATALTVLAQRCAAAVAR